MGALIRSLRRTLASSLLVASVIGVSCGIAQASQESPSASDCPGPDILEQQPSLSALVAIRRYLSRQALEQACLASADYLWLRGLIDRQLGDFSGASTWFELSMLRQPQRAGVLLDFAIAREAMGDLVSARSIYQSLLDDYDPPASLRQLITARLKVVEATLRERPASSQAGFINPDTQTLRSSADRFVTQSAVWYGQVSVSQGYDSNLNSASSLRALNFQIDDQIYSLEIPQSDQPQAGRFQTVSSRLGHQGAYQGGRWGINMRQSLRLTEATRLRSGVVELGADASYSLSSFGPLSGEIQGYLGKQWLGLDSAIVLRSDRFAVSYEFSRRINVLERECSMQVGLEHEQRRYPSRQVLDGNLTHRGVKMLCNDNDKRLELFTRVGSDDQIDPSRAGGLQSKHEWGAVVVKEYPRQMIRLHWFASKSVDKIGYNILIKNNKIRESNRNHLGFEWALKVDGSRLEPFLGYERTTQRSTIAIFSFTGWQLSAGVRWSF